MKFCNLRNLKIRSVKNLGFRSLEDSRVSRFGSLETRKFEGSRVLKFDDTKIRELGIWNLESSRIWKFKINTNELLASVYKIIYYVVLTSYKEYNKVMGTLQEPVTQIGILEVLSQFKQRWFVL